MASTISQRMPAPRILVVGDEAVVRQRVSEMSLENHDLEPLVRRHFSSKASGLSWSWDFAEPLENGQLFICASPPMRKFREEIRALAGIDGPVLILGESGSGRETTARLIHRLSPRARSSLVKVNCAPFAGEILESELFGQERGGVRSRTGKLALCHKGVIVLEGIGEMSANAQAKLLQLFQDSQILPVGSEDSVEVDVRVLALGNLDLPHAVKERRFREDLYYLLSAFTIVVPPLRERKEDIPLLLQHFMERMAAQYQRSTLPFSPATIDACRNYMWPGNLRELENFVKRYLIMGDEEAALNGLAEMSVNYHLATTESIPRPDDADAMSLRSLIRSVRGEAEKNAIAAALESTRWNRKAAARLLKVSYRSLLYKIEEYHMTPRHGHAVHS